MNGPVDDPDTPTAPDEVWMYAESNGEDGDFAIQLFKTRKAALIHKTFKHSAYGSIRKMKVWPERNWPPQEWHHK